LDDQIIDLGLMYPDLISFLAHGNLSAAGGPALPASEVQWLPPIPKPGKVVCVGLNYRSHIALLDEPVSEYPAILTKPGTSLIGSGDAIVLPKVSTQVDYEGELAVVIGRRGKYISEKDALAT
jgi:2-keto-4-pentenoate hydratase/2-oxohepta-3-ene-1,7-dioic acid hydratase in catechol pathway